jgi:hypothetical protein
MPYRPEYLTVIVECLDARWKFTTPDEALVDYGDYAARRRAALAAEYAVLGENPPVSFEDYATDKCITEYAAQGGDAPELRKIACAAFREGLVGWEGVEAPDGRPLPFTRENVLAIPMPAKEAVGDAYLMTLSGLGEKKIEPTSPPTDSTPPAVPTAE